MAYRSPRGDVRSVWIGDVRPELDGGRFPVKREVGDTFEVTADILQEGHGGLAARAPLPDSEGHGVARGADGAPRQRPVGRPVPPGGEHPVRLHARGVAGCLPELGRGSPEAPGGRHGRDERAPRGRGAPARRPRARRGGRSPPARGAPGRVRGRDRRRPPCAPPPQRGGRGDPRRLSGPRGGDAVRPGARGGGGPTAGPVRRLVRAVPAVAEPGAGPTRHLPGLHRAAAGDRRHGLRRGLPAADPSDRPELPEGAQQRARGGSRRPGLAVGHRQRARRAQGDRARAGHAGRLPGLPPRRPGPRDRGRARLRAPVLAGPSLGDGASRVVPPPAGRDDQVRREPAEEVPGHLPAELLRPGARGALGGGEGHPPLLDRAGDPDLPRGQPPHQADPVLVLGDRGGPGRPPRRDLPRRGLHAPAGRAGPREGRLHPVLHVLHVAELQAGADRLPHGADARGDGGVLPRELLREHAGHPAAHPAAGRAAGLPDAPRAGGHALVRSTGSTAATSSARTPPFRAPRSTSTPRSTRSRSRDWDAPGNIRAYVDAPQPDPPREPGAPRVPEPRLLRERRRARPLLREAQRGRGERRPRGGEPRSLRGARGGGSACPSTTLGIGSDESFQAHELVTDERHLWRGPSQHVRLDPRVEPAAIFRLERFGQRAYGTPCY